MNQGIRKRITGIRIISIGTFLGFLSYTSVVLGQSVPPRPPVEPFRGEEAERDARIEKDEKVERDERGNDPARAVTTYVNGRGPIPTGPANVARPTPGNIRPSFEPPSGTVARPVSAAPFVPLSPQQRAEQEQARGTQIRRLQAGLQTTPPSPVRTQLEAELGRLQQRDANKKAIEILEARIGAEKNPEYREILLRERARLESGEK